MKPVAGRAVLGNLPPELTSFVGRRRELGEVKRLLSGSRLVTLTGIGGVGKTRLAGRVATEVQRAFPDGVWFIDLTQLQDPDLLTNEVQDPEQLANLVVGALRLPAQPNRAPLEHLCEYVAARTLLLVLDSCEHLLPSCAVLADRLLRSCPHLRVVATSREPLWVSGEVLFEVPPLAPPPDGSSAPADLARVDSVALFVARAAAVLPGFQLTTGNHAAVSAICYQLDGLPLAIELAAARMRVLGPGEILERLSDRFALLSRGHRTAPQRQQTLRACLDWSFDLCAKPERNLWTRLSIFAGGTELDAVEGICTDEQLPPDDILDLVASLVDKSILARMDGAPVARFRMLETVREFGLQNLRGVSAEAALRRRHRDWYVQLVTRADQEWISERQAYWQARLRREHPNIRLAVEYCLADPREAEVALRIAVSLPPLHWISMGLFREGRRWLDRALAQATAPTALRARALLLASHLTMSQGDPAGIQLLDQGEVLGERLNASGELAYATYLRGTSAMFGEGDLPAAIALFDRALSALPTTSGSTSDLRLQLLLTLGTAVGLVGDQDRAVTCEREVLRLTQPWDNGFYRVLAIWGPAFAAWQSGDLDTAAALVSEPLRHQQTLGFSDRYTIGQSLEVMAWIAAAAGQPTRAATLLGAAEAFWTDVGSSMGAHRHFEGHHRDCARRTSDMLDENAFSAALDYGGGLTAEQAVAFALEEQPAPVPAAGEAAVLSRRECQVAELIAQGLSNKEIASRLVISQRTAESHVEHILIKLGFARRAQVAAWKATQQSRDQDS